MTDGNGKSLEKTNSISQKKESNSCPTKLWNCWLDICIPINKLFERLFYKWAGIAGKHAKIVIVVSLLLALGATAGFLRYSEEAQNEKLFFPQTSTATKDLDRAEHTFPSKYIREEFILSYLNGGSVLNEKMFISALMLHNGIINTRYNEICKRITSDESLNGCLIEGSLELFLYDQRMISDVTIVPTLLAALKNHTLLMKNGRTASVNMQYYLGKFKYNKTADQISAQALSMRYMVKFSESSELYKKRIVIEKDIIDFLQSKKAELLKKGIILNFVAGRSMDDEVSEYAFGDFKFVSVALLLVGLAITFILMRFGDSVSGHFSVGLVGIGCMILGLGAGFGLVLASGEKFVSFATVSFFIVLGIGLDDMFIILDALDCVDSKIKGIERLQVALGKVGASITMTTATDLVTFVVSSTSAIPAARYVCIYLGTAISLSYLLIVTLFVAVLSLDIKRIESGRMDLAMCKKAKKYEPWKTKKSFGNKAMLQWGKFLMFFPVRLAVLVSTFIFLGISIYAATKVEHNHNLEQFLEDGSYVSNYLAARGYYYPAGFAVNIIQDNDEFDYSSITNQIEYIDLSEICARSGYFEADRTINWMSSFLESSHCSGRNSRNCSGGRFYQTLQHFLQDHPTFNVDLKWKNQKVEASRIVCRERFVNEWMWQKDSMLQTRQDFNEKKSVTGLFPIAFNYFYREGITVVEKEILRNMIICAFVILVITTPYLVHPTVIFLLFFGFVSLVVELFALMYVWNVSINSVSMMMSLMAIGFAVDYSAHIAHSYIRSDAVSPEERIIEALGTVGCSVSSGGISTFLGCVATGFGSSEIFRIYFKMTLGIVVLGLLHGLLFLPVLLTVFCRTNVRITDKPTRGVIRKENNNDDQTSEEIREVSISEYPNLAYVS